MRNALPRLLHRPRRSLPSPPPRNGCDSSENPPLKCFLARCQAVEIRSGQTIDHIRPSDHLLRRRFSTGFTSVHGGRPSAEYAKLRKESLESQFGNILGTYGSKTWFAYQRFGPFLALYRAAIISFQVAKLTVWHFLLQDINKRAVKLGQALSTRSDILPTAYCQELSKLQILAPNLLRLHHWGKCIKSYSSSTFWGACSCESATTWYDNLVDSGCTIVPYDWRPTEAICKGSQRFIGSSE